VLVIEELVNVIEGGVDVAAPIKLSLKSSQQEASASNERTAEAAALLNVN
jgi:hypothetical protein